MQSLDLKVPPPVVAVLAALAMWGISLATPRFELPAVLRAAAALASGIVGVGIAVSGALAFHRARTTASPVKPEAASTLVTSGVYRFTRNPMYLGLCLVLVAWALFLSSAWALLGPVGFVLYISRFQILPEESALTAIFGTAFSSYRAKVRRWL
jgi:protein-S-isoprenylcysteine O-methyltransferase Ste14